MDIWRKSILGRKLLGGGMLGICREKEGCHLFETE